MTSNLGSHMIQQMADSDYGVVKLAVMGEVKTHFRPEFINRIDEVVVFHALGEDQIKSIAAIQLNVLKARLAKMDYGFEISDAAIGELAKVGFDPVYGARPLKRAIQSEIENPLAKSILEGRFAPKDTIRADYRGGRMVFEKSKARAAA
jgi:ATP-dependent Clp protease ATP-binding subunit ClpB